MADTQRSISQILALFADNATGQISAQDLRDFAVSTIIKNQNVETLSGNRVLTTVDATIQKLDPGGADRDVTLPAEADSTDLVFIILNTADGAGENLVIKDDSPATLATIGPGTGAFCTCDGTGWGVYILLPSQLLVIDNVFGRVTFMQTTAAGLRFIRDNHDSYELSLKNTRGLLIQNLTDNRAELEFKGTGAIGIGNSNTWPSANDGKVLVFGDNAADPTMGADTAGIYAKDVTGTVEMFAVDEAGNVTQLSQHAQDAPNWFCKPVIDPVSGAEYHMPNIKREVQVYLGFVRWTNITRMAMLTGLTSAEKDALGKEDRTCIYHETFDEYNTRMGFEKGDNGYLEQLAWDEVQQTRYDMREAEIQAATIRKEKLTKALLEEVDEKKSAKIQAKLDTLEVPESYTKKSKPGWLKK